MSTHVRRGARAKRIRQAAADAREAAKNVQAVVDAAASK